MNTMRITTPHRDYYIVDLKTGNITQDNTFAPKLRFSGGWKFVGFVSVRSASPTVVISLKDIQDNPAILKTTEWQYKNGNPRYTVRDLDYGTTRVWGNTKHHGAHSAYIES